jgi:hypothetical protein
MLKRIIFFVILTVFCTLKIKASHIVGGEFKVSYSGNGYIYNVYLNMYYDDLNAEPELINADLTIDISIFNKTSNGRVKTFQLRRTSAGLISYNTNGCNDAGTLKTRLLRYNGTLDMTGMTNPGGYYMAWERCCRNYQTLNIVHQDFFGTTISGQTFYIELPPVSFGGVRFINSSPSFEVAPAQYLCKDNYTLIDFSATDADGDSLVYTMINPLQGHSSELDVAPTTPYPAPYADITWQPGYSAVNAIHGNPALSVNASTGMLTVKPSETGLYAFAVNCEEYRNGIKIGEVRRDFQYLIQNCPVKYAPSVGLNKSNNNNSDPGSTDWDNSDDPDTLYVKLNKDTCYTIFVTDSSRFFSSEPEEVSIFYGKTSLPKTSIAFSPSRVTISPTNDTTTMNMCFSTCDRVLIEKDSVYFLDIIVQDGNENTCPRKTDTLRTYVYVDVEESNQPPVIGTSLQPLNALTTYPDTLTSFYVYGLDPDLNDIKSIEAKGVRFSLDQYNMRFVRVYSGTDSVAYRFTWTPNCEYLKDRSDYRIDFVLKDESCIYTHKDTVSVRLKLEDVDTGLQNYIPTNLITPNGDNLNDCFYLKDLPANNCTYIFRSFSVYNRWGATVYTSSDRNFRWCPEDLSDGIYYYYVDLSAKGLKSWIQILR